MLPIPWIPEPLCFYSHFDWGMCSTDLEYQCLMLYSRKYGFHVFCISRKYFKWQKNILPKSRQNIQSDSNACAKIVKATILVYCHFKLTLHRLCRAASGIPLSHPKPLTEISSEYERSPPADFHASCLTSWTGKALPVLSPLSIAHLLVNHPALLSRN